MPMKKTISSNHAKLSASGSQRWINCPGSVEACGGYSDSKSVYAAQGSVAHELAEWCLRTGDNPYVWVGREEAYDGFDILIDREMADGVKKYIGYCNELPTDIDARAVVETKFDYSNLVRDGFGTVDFGLIDKTRLVAVDFKYGKGVVVSANDNTQGFLYLYGMYQSLTDAQRGEIDTFEVHIVQPRRDHFPSWIFGREEFDRWSEIIRVAALRTEELDAPRIPGERQCRWCPHQNNCEEYADYKNRSIVDLF